MATERNDDGFDALFRSEFPSVLRAAQVIVGDPELARDVAQDAFTKLFVHWKKVADYDLPGAWVRRVAINGAISAAKRNQRRRRATDAFGREHSRAVTGVPPDHRIDDLSQALGTLSPQQRASVALFYLEDLSVAEVAAALGTSESTVKVHLHRARQRLGTALHEEVSDVVG